MESSRISPTISTTSQSVAEMESSTQLGCDLCGLLVEGLAIRTYYPSLDNDAFDVDLARSAVDSEDSADKSAR